MCMVFLHVVLYYCEVGKASRGRHGCLKMCRETHNDGIPGKGLMLWVGSSLIPTPHVDLPKRGCGTMSYNSTCSYYYVSIDSNVS